MIGSDNQDFIIFQVFLNFRQPIVKFNQSIYITFHISSMPINCIKINQVSKNQSFCIFLQCCNCFLNSIQVILISFSIVCNSFSIEQVARFSNSNYIKSSFFQSFKHCFFWWINRKVVSVCSSFKFSNFFTNIRSCNYPCYR